MRQRSVLASMVVLVALVAAACTSGSGDSSSGDSGSGGSSATTAELVGVWSTEDGAVTFEFLDDGETALLTTDEFEECRTAYEGGGDQVVVDIECGSLDGAGQSSLGGGATGVVTVGASPQDFYSAEWTLVAAGKAGLDEEGLSGAPAVGESAAGAPGVIAERLWSIKAIDEDDSSTVSYQTQVRATLARPCENPRGICQ